MVTVKLDEYFDSYDYITKINSVEFEDLDLSEFFENADAVMKAKIKEKYTRLNNYNIIYVLSAYEQNRSELGLILSNKK